MGDCWQAPGSIYNLNLVFSKISPRSHTQVAANKKCKNHHFHYNASALCFKMNTLWVHQLINCIWPGFLFHQTEWWELFSIWQDAYLWCRWFGLLPVSSLRGRHTSSTSVPQQKAGKYAYRDSSSSDFHLNVVTHMHANTHAYMQKHRVNRVIESQVV